MKLRSTAARPGSCPEARCRDGINVSDIAADKRVGIPATGQCTVSVSPPLQQAVAVRQGPASHLVAERDIERLVAERDIERLVERVIGFVVAAV
jgi:hypothetical protein